MKPNTCLFAIVSLFFPFFIITMEMNSEASVLQDTEDEREKLGNGFDNALMCVCGPCFRLGNCMSKKITKCCTGQELPMSATCQECFYRSTQLLLWNHLYHAGTGLEKHLDVFGRVCAISAGSTGCLAYLAYRLECFQKKQHLSEVVMPMPERPAIMVMDEILPGHAKAE